MSNPENSATGIDEDLSDPLQFMVKYEVEKYRLVTEADALIAGCSAAGALAGGLAMDAALYSGTESLVTAPVNAAGRVVRSAYYGLENLNGPSGSRSYYSPRVNANQEQQTVTVPTNTRPAHVSLGRQAEILGGSIALVTFTLAAAHSALRYRATRRLKNFKSKLTINEFQEHWGEDNPSSSA